MAKKDFQEILFIESAQGPFSRLGRVVSAKRFSEILAQAWATVSGMMSSQREPTLLSINNTRMTQLQLSDTHGASSASPALQNGRHSVHGMLHNTLASCLIGTF